MAARHASVASSRTEDRSLRTKAKRKPRQGHLKGTSAQVLASSSNLFIVATSLQSIKPDTTSRRLIRSHVMQGRYRPPDRPRRPEIGSWINRDHDPERLDDPGLASCLLPSRHTSTSRLPPQVTSLDVSLTPFAVEMKPYMLELMHRFYNGLSQPVHPLECLVDTSTQDLYWYHDLAEDPAFVHAVLFVVQAYSDLQRRRAPSHRAILHMNETVALIQLNLADSELATRDSTIFAVLMLGLVFEASGDIPAARAHMNGLYQLVQLRGGVAAFNSRYTLQLKICRLDLGYAAKCGFKPMFFSDENAISWKSYLADSSQPSTTPLHTLCKLPDTRLVNVWLDLREFVRSTNLAFQTNRTIGAELYQEILISVQYRLQILAYDKHSAHEILRLGMLAFSTPIFLDVHSIPGNYEYLAKQLREVLESLEWGGSPEWQKLSLWVLFASKLSVLSAPDDDGWLHERLQDVLESLGAPSWSEVRDILMGYLWVDAVNNERGVAFYKQSRRPEQ